jgi:hypothetical protein
MAATNAWTGASFSGMLRSVAGDPISPAPGCFTGPVNGSGLLPGTVTQTSSPSQAVVVTKSTWVIPGSNPSVSGGAVWSLGSDVTVPLGLAPHATNPRIDLLTAQIIDPGSSTTPVTCDFVWVHGTAAASPVAPPLPAGATLVTTVSVPSGASSNLVNANISNDRLFTGLRGAILAVPDKAKISVPQVGDKVVDSSNVRWECTNAGWKQLHDQDIQTGTWTITLSSGAQTGSVTFSRPFAHIPKVVANASPVTGNTAVIIDVSSVTTTQFNYRASLYSNTGAYNGSVTGTFIAVDDA